ncbi:MAG: ABC transporter permease, partial [Candidatus Rokubacteria bacterium]|nr:ABC transporter permease [Candidatus Rokubacteria bacterium]
MNPAVRSGAREWARRLHLPTLLVFLIVLGIWELFARRYGPYILPQPGSVLSGIWAIFLSGELWTHTVAS